MPRRSGIALVLVICVILVVAVFGAVLKLLTQAAAVEVDVVTEHVRAVAVGELAFGAVVARLGATPWRERWFRDAPEVQSSVDAGGGTYSYLLRDAPAPVSLGDPLSDAALGGPGQADLLVRATHGRATVVMFWRLNIPQDSLDNLTTVVPTYFGFGPEGAQPTPADADPLSALVNQAIKDRLRNAPRAAGLAGKLGAATGPRDAGAALGVDPGPGAVEGVPAPGASGGGPLHPVPPTPAGALPGSLAPADPTLEGTWVSDYQDLHLSNGDPVTHHARDYLLVKQVGDTVSGHCQFVDDQGLVMTEWDFTATRVGNRLQFPLVNLRTLITGQDAPGTSLTMDLTISGDSMQMTGINAFPGGSTPQHYARFP